MDSTHIIGCEVLRLGAASPLKLATRISLTSIKALRKQNIYSMTSHKVTSRSQRRLDCVLLWRQCFHAYRTQNFTIMLLPHRLEHRTPPDGSPVVLFSIDPFLARRGFSLSYMGGLSPPTTALIRIGPADARRIRPWLSYVLLRLTDPVFRPTLHASRSRDASCISDLAHTTGFLRSDGTRCAPISMWSSLPYRQRVPVQSQIPHQYARTDTALPSSLYACAPHQGGL